MPKDNHEMKANSNKYTKRKRSQSRTSYEKSKAAKTDQVDRLDSEKSTSRSSDSGSHDDTVGHFAGLKGDLIRNRYEILKISGLGTFGKVFECIDKKHSDRVAVKMIRNVPRYVESAMIEADILHDINQAQKKYKSDFCVKMYAHFKFEGHYAIVFERLGISLYDFIKMNDYRGLPLYCVRDVA
eukprot:gene15063-31953_t